MKKIIVYDFDKTIYGGETGTDFFKFYFKKFPLKSIIFLIKYAKEVVLYILKKISLKDLKERFFMFLNGYKYNEIEKLVKEFWKKNEHKMYKWEKNELNENKKKCDLIIVSSASPTFLIKDFLLSRGYDLVFGTDFYENGTEFISKIIGNNNKNKEKVIKINKWAKENNIEYEILKFYSDSLADKPLYDISIEKIWIDKGNIVKGIPTKKTLIDKIFWK